VVKQPAVTYNGSALDSWVTQYFDETSQPLSRVVTNGDPAGTPGSTWATYVVRDDTDGLLTTIHSPANVATYTHNESGSSDPDGAFTVESSDGLVTVFTRTTSAQDADLAGFVRHVKWRKGSTGSQNLDRSVFYVPATDPERAKLTVGDVTVVRPLAHATTEYTLVTTTEDTGPGSAPPTGANRTKFTYDLYNDGTEGHPLAIEEITTTFPAVSTTHNGSGSSTSAKQYFDEAGRVVFEKTTEDVINYWQYRSTDGQLEKTIEDADTSEADFGAGCPYSSPPYTSTGAPLHRVTCYTYTGGGSGPAPPGNCTCDLDAEGNTAQTGSGPTAVSYTAKLADGRFATLSFTDWQDDSPNDRYYGPVTYTVTDHAGQVALEGVIALDDTPPGGEYTTDPPTDFVDETDDDPVTAIDNIGAVAQMTTYVFSETGGSLEESRLYFQIPASGAGTEGTDYDATVYGIDDRGRLDRVKDPTGTIQRTVYDALGRTTEQWLGTNDYSFAGGETTGPDNMVKTTALAYDVNSNLTLRTLYVQSTATGKRETAYAYDVRGNVVLQTNPTPPHVFTEYDNLGRATAAAQYSSTSGIVLATENPRDESDNRLALSQTFYDELGRVWKSQRHKIDDADGSDDDNLQTLTWYDEDGRVIKLDGAQLTKTFHDRLGRRTHEFVLANDNDSGYGDADDVFGDIVLEESQTVFESNDSDNVLMMVVIDRHHDDYGTGHTTGALDDNNDGDPPDPDPLEVSAADIHGRVQITASWYDRLDRLTDTVVFGMYDTNDDGDFDTFNRSDAQWNNPPARADDKLRTTYAYHLDGTLKSVTDPEVLVTQHTYDAAGRQTKVVSNYDGGAPAGDANRTIKYEYTDGLRTKMTADLPSGQTDQVTDYSYGVSTGDSPGASKFDAKHLLRQVTYPDSGGAGDVVRFAYNAQGQPIWTQDQEGNVIETDYDDGGRETHRRVTTLASGFDGAVRRISSTYDDLGRVQKVNQYDDATVGDPDTVVNEVQYVYDDWGNIETFKQDRDGDGDITAYDVSYTYAKATGGRNTVRRTGMELPNGDDLTFTYASTEGTDNIFDDDASRVTNVADPTPTTVVRYWYNGVGQVVGRIYPQPEVRWEHYGSTSGLYPDLDRFNRVTSSRWTKDQDPPTADLDFYYVDVTYDRNSNVTLTQDNIFVGFDVDYTIDDLNRLRKAEEGTWSGSAITNRTRQQLWEDPSAALGLDQAGNWDHVRLDLDGDNVFTGTGEYDDDRTYNEVNELTARDTDDDDTNDYTLSYDDAGNVADDGQHYEYVYDAFGRLRKVQDTDDQTLVAEYSYNGLGYRQGAKWDADGQGGLEWRYFAYDEQWRVVAMYEPDGNQDNVDEQVEQFVYHTAGLSGYGGSSYLDEVLLREWDSNGDGTLETCHYYCQNWRGDMVAMVTKNGTIADRVRYSAYGIPFGIPGGDLTEDGVVNVQDQLRMLSWWTPNYDVRGDLNLDHVVNNGDFLVLLAYWGNSAGQGVLSAIDNRKGYAGYEFDPAVQAKFTVYHVRRRALNSDLGRWLTRDPLGYVDGVSLYEYVRSNPIAGADPYGTGPSGGGGPAPGGGGLRQHTGPKKTPCGPGNPYCTFTTCAPCQFGSCPTGAGLEIGPGPSPIGGPCAGKHCAGGRGGDQLQSWIGKETRVIDQGVARDVSSQSVPPGGFQPGPPGRPADMCRYGQSRNRRRVVPCEDGGAKVCVRREVCRWSIANRILVWDYNPRVDGPENCTNCFGDATKMPPLPPGAPLPPVIVGRHPCEDYRDMPTQDNCQDCCDSICSDANMINPASLLPTPGCPIAIGMPSTTDFCGRCYLNCPPY
jgi:RHS repeat-associated protein